MLYFQRTNWRASRVSLLAVTVTTTQQPWTACNGIGSFTFYVLPTVRNRNTVFIIDTLSTGRCRCDRDIQWRRSRSLLLTFQSQRRWPHLPSSYCSTMRRNLLLQTQVDNKKTILLLTVSQVATDCENEHLCRIGRIRSTQLKDGRKRTKTSCQLWFLICLTVSILTVSLICCWIETASSALEDRAGRGTVAPNKFVSVKFSAHLQICFSSAFSNRNDCTPLHPLLEVQW
jgi:hypothetical protein